MHTHHLSRLVAYFHIPEVILLSIQPVAVPFALDELVHLRVSFPFPLFGFPPAGLAGGARGGGRGGRRVTVKKAACTRSIRQLSDWTQSLCPRRPSAHTSGTPSDWGKEARWTAAASRRSARGSAGPARRSWSTWSTGWTRSPHSLEGKELNRPVPAGVWAPSTHRWRGPQQSRPPWAHSSPPASGCPLRPAGKRPCGRCAAIWEHTGSTRPAASRTGPCASRRRGSSSVGWPAVWTEGSWYEGWSSLPHERTTPPDSDCLLDRTRCPYICPMDLEKTHQLIPEKMHHNDAD